MFLTWFSPGLPFLIQNQNHLGTIRKKKLRAIPRPVGPSGAGDEWPQNMTCRINIFYILLSQPYQNIVITLSQPCHNIVTRLSQHEYHIIELVSRQTTSATTWLWSWVWKKYSILFNNHMQILLEVVCSAPFQNLWNTMKYTMLLTCQSMPPASRHSPLSGLSNQHWEWVDWSIISESGKGKTWTLFGKWKKTAAAATTTTTTRTRTRTGRKTKRQQPRILPFTHPPSHSLGGVGVPHFVVNQPLSLQNGSGTESPSYKMVCL